ncbi:MAG: M13 family metallopeptidase [Myxococcaceae bacterium]
MHRARLIVVLAASLPFLATPGCKTAEPTPAPAHGAALETAKPFPPGLEATALNTAANPCDDFYEYACGGWLKSTEIPEDRSRWGRGIDGLFSRNEEVLKKILEDTAAGKPPAKTPYVTQLAALYTTCMDEPALENTLTAFKAERAKLTVNNPKALAHAVAVLHTRGAAPLFNLSPIQDFKDATLVIGQVDQNGLGLPDRAYYLSDAEKMKTVREAYAAHMEKMFTLVGDAKDKAKTSAAAVMAIETALAKASLSKVDRREPAKMYHRIERKGLQAAAPKFQWDEYFKTMGVPKLTTLSVTHVPFMEEVSALVAQTPPAQLSAYLSWSLIQSSGLALPKALQDEGFAFRSTHLTGAKADLPRWKKCVRLVDNALPHALSVPYVALTFGDQGKARMSKMVTDVETAFERNLDALTWMDAKTKAGALEKIRKVVNKIGFPERWRTYDGLALSKTSLFTNLDAANTFEVHRQLAKIGKPVDRTEWLLSPAQVNAYYNPPMNEIVLLAGILQPPYFNLEASEAVNYGGIGTVVGHEFSHGFDDEGRQFDEAGNLRDWWTPEAGTKFVEKASCVKKQFDSYVAVADVKVNGALTLGENVADLAGLKLAHAAMEQRLASEPDLRGNYSYTPSQQFFLGFAQAWCSKTREAYARAQVLADPHSPAHLRVNGPLRNFTGFQKAFSCPDNAKMVRPVSERCEVW